MREIVAAADAQRDACLEAAAEDEAAFSAVAAAMKMPRGTAEEKEARRRRLSEVSLDATRPPLAVLAAAAELVALARRVLPIANPNLVSDVAAATAAARAAATTARLAVEANLPGIDDDARPGRPGLGRRRRRGPGAPGGRDRGRGAAEDAPVTGPLPPIARPGRCVVMGILNVTPDSFSDGGRHDTVEAAVAHGLAPGGRRRRLRRRGRASRRGPAPTAWRSRRNSGGSCPW